MRAIKALERILATIPIMLGVAIIVFIFMRLTPGDPVDIMMGDASVSPGEIENLRKEFHLDKPLILNLRGGNPLDSQLFIYLGDVLRGDLGNSYIKRKPVAELIGEHLPATIELALGALIFGLAIAIPLVLVVASINIRIRKMEDLVASGLSRVLDTLRDATLAAPPQHEILRR